MVFNPNFHDLLPRTSLKSDTSPVANIRSPCMTPLIPKSGRYFKHSFNFFATAGGYISSHDSGTQHIFGFSLLNTDFVPTKNSPDKGSIPHTTAGAPSHLVCIYPTLELPSIFLASTKSITIFSHPSTP